MRKPETCTPMLIDADIGSILQDSDFSEALEPDRAYYRHRLQVAGINLPQKARLTKQLLADIESLLIFEIQPWGNIQSRESRIARSGLELLCNGSWLHRQRVFRDP